jgi:hypothetical protein
MAFRLGFLVLKLGMDSRKRRMKSLRHFRESYSQSRPPADQYIIMAGTHGATSGRKSHNFAQPPANPVALDGATGLPGHGETDAHRAMISPMAPLEDKCPVRGSHAAGCGPKIAPALQPLDDDVAAPIRH